MAPFDYDIGIDLDGVQVSAKKRVIATGSMLSPRLFSGTVVRKEV